MDLLKNLLLIGECLLGKNEKGQIIYTSARDIGNIAAGYIAGANGMSWQARRAAFDAYQSKINGRLEIEGISTRNAEYYGWRMGYNQLPYKKLNNFKISMKEFLKAVLNKIVE